MSKRRQNVFSALVGSLLMVLFFGIISLAEHANRADAQDQPYWQQEGFNRVVYMSEYEGEDLADEIEAYIYNLPPECVIIHYASDGYGRHQAIIEREC